jgi:hypothetical protein
MKQLICMAVVCLIAPMAAMAQDAGANPLSSAVQMTLNQFAKNLVATAEEMPADKYSYAPTKEEMTFGKSVAHIAEVNNFVCSNISEMPAPPPKMSDADSKEKLVAGLKASMDYCAQAYSKLTDAKLKDSVPFYGGRKITRLGAALEVNYDLVDHYAALAVYLRLNGLLPPTAQKKP